jgi:hypothetical protein
MFGSAANKRAPLRLKSHLNYFGKSEPAEFVDRVLTDEGRNTDLRDSIEILVLIGFVNLQKKDFINQLGARLKVLIRIKVNIFQEGCTRSSHRTVLNSPRNQHRTLLPTIKYWHENLSRTYDLCFKDFICPNFDMSNPLFLKLRPSCC